MLARQRADNKLISALKKKEDKADMAAQKRLEKTLAKEATLLQKQNEKAERCWMKMEDQSKQVILVTLKIHHPFRHP